MSYRDRRECQEGRPHRALSNALGRSPAGTRFTMVVAPVGLAASTETTSKEVGVTSSVKCSGGVRRVHFDERGFAVRARPARLSA